MHDPRTVAFEIRNIFVRDDNVYPGYHPPIITIWHVDPEADGSDDSCDWRGGRLTIEEYAKIQKLAASEHHFYFDYDLIAIKNADPFTVIAAAWRSAKYGLYKKHGLSHKELEIIISLATNPTDNLRSQAMASESSPVELSHLFLMIGRQIKRLHRPWWRHPKWHVHHWRFQVHPWQRLRRWLFDRCVVCGGRFEKGSPIAEWDGGNLRHGSCDHLFRKGRHASSHQNR